MPELSPRRWIVTASLFLCSFVGSAVAANVIEITAHRSTSRFEEWTMFAQALIVAPVPEPAALMLFGIGLLLAASRLRSRQGGNSGTDVTSKH